MKDCPVTMPHHPISLIAMAKKPGEILKMMRI
jgi:hypothetical protein